VRVTKQVPTSRLTASISAANVDSPKKPNAKPGREGDTDVQGARKRTREVDELDALFEGVRVNRFGKAGLLSETIRKYDADRIGAPVSRDILDAIKAAPKGEVQVKRKRKA
jgi:hypothetical protein